MCALFNLISRNQRLSSIYTVSEFHDRLDNECERADRYHKRFSLAIFEMDTGDENNVIVRRLVRTLYRRFRDIDELGWFSNTQIGVILPYTPAKGAWKLAEDVCELISALSTTPPFTIYSYPSQNWPRKRPGRLWGLFSFFVHERRMTSRYHSIYSSDEFRTVLDIERSRADRSGHVFSLVIFNLLSREIKTFSPRNFVRKLTLRLRETDEIGWFDTNHISVILPYATPENAYKMVNNFCSENKIFSKDIFSIYTYPTSWLPEKITGGTTAHNNSSVDLNRNGQENNKDIDNEEKTGRNKAVISRIDVQEIEDFFVRPIPWWKRSLDIFGALFCLILLSPLFLIIAAAVKLTSSGQVLFKQERAGLAGKPFMIYKFRSMRQGAEEMRRELIAFNERTGPVFKMKNDPRITPLGKYLRKWSLDELPQLINVLKGDMSLVGPRPLPVMEDKGFNQWHTVRRHIKPGITCLWQISARHENNFDDWIRLDIEYAKRQSFLLDIKILFQTVPAVIKRKGAY